ncbi:Start control protein cdc10 [Smittium mucronatum]|uniref:Start control protein cdc10 n=1 Tax=Smittium mucronatum TaxID=133383 RepID=A0A1R0GQT3_9FUNG|nr:Start control protein cdc10 [Smittium mucronatum]
MSVNQQYSRVYSAIYSGVPVYEMVCRGVAVMRRQPDSWLNATQILKVAGIDKGRRTKILEREVLNSKHEKVQGGYGKYQGTWVPFERGVQLSEQYGVMEYLKPIIEYDPELTENGVDQTPTKAELKQKMDLEQKLISKRNIISANKKRKDIPKNNIMDPPPLAPATLKRNKDIDLNFRNDQKFYNSFVDPPKNKNIYFNTFPTQKPQTQFIKHENFIDINPKKYPIAPNFLSNNVPPKALQINFPATPTAPTAPPAPTYTPIPPPSPPAQSSNRSDEDMKQDKIILTGLFMNDDPNYIPNWLSDASSQFLNGVEISKLLNITLDDQGHTSVHWAAALARIEVLDLLLARGADAKKLNFDGESALIKAVQVINNYENQSFQDLLELLHDVIPLTDNSNRSVLHHISLTSGVEGRKKASHFYLECLLGWISRLSGGFIVENSPSSSNDHSQTRPSLPPNSKSVQNHDSINESKSNYSTPSSELKTGNATSPKLSDFRQNTGSDNKYSNSGSHNGPDFYSSSNTSNIKIGFFTPQTKSTSMYSSRNNNNHEKTSRDEDSPNFSIINNSDFLSFLDLQDANGDTALNIAAQFNDRTLIQLLISSGASISIPNRSGIKPSDFWATDTYTKNLVLNYIAPKGAGRAFDIPSSNNTPLSLAPYHSSAPPTTMVQSHTSNIDYFASPTKGYFNELGKNNISTLSTLKAENIKANLSSSIDAENYDYRSSRNLATNLELAFKNSSNIDHFADQKSNILPNITSMFKRNIMNEISNDSNKNKGLSDSPFPNKKMGVNELIINENGKTSTLDAIRQLMDDLENEFREQLEKKQTELDNLGKILQETRADLSLANESISKLRLNFVDINSLKDGIKDAEQYVDSIKPNSYISDQQLENLRDIISAIATHSGTSGPNTPNRNSESDKHLVSDLNKTILIELEPIISVYQNDYEPDSKVEEILGLIRMQNFEYMDFTKLVLVLLDRLGEIFNLEGIPRLMVNKLSVILRQFILKFEKMMNLPEESSSSSTLNENQSDEIDSFHRRPLPSEIIDKSDVGEKKTNYPQVIEKNDLNGVNFSTQNESANKYRNLVSELLQIEGYDLDIYVDKIGELIRLRLQDSGNVVTDELKKKIESLISEKSSLHHP